MIGSRRVPARLPRVGRLGFTIVELVVVLAILAILVAMLLPAVRRSSDPPRRTACKNNLKNIMFAMHNYHDVHGHFPPAFTVDEDGNKLHSWRTLLLPFLEQTELYESIDLTKPWNHSVNAAAREADLAVFRCPSSAPKAPGFTLYMGLVGPNAFFSSDGTPRSLTDLTDGTGETIAITEISADRAVHWMNPTAESGAEYVTMESDRTTSHPRGFQIAMADGSARFLDDSVPVKVRTALISIAGGDKPRNF